MGCSWVKALPGFCSLTLLLGLWVPIKLSDCLSCQCLVPPEKMPCVAQCGLTQVGPNATLPSRWCQSPVVLCLLRFVQKTGKDDYTMLFVISAITDGPTVPTAMCMFFLLAAYFTPGSYQRKGAWKHVVVSLHPSPISTSPSIACSFVLTPTKSQTRTHGNLPGDQQPVALGCTL
jgi:hypothetical protein